MIGVILLLFDKMYIIGKTSFLVIDLNFKQSIIGYLFFFVGKNHPWVNLGSPSQKQFKF